MLVILNWFAMHISFLMCQVTLAHRWMLVKTFDLHETYNSFDNW